MKFLFLLFSLMMPEVSHADAKFVNRSSTIFFPSSMNKLITVNQAYPLFWWNFLVLEKTKENKTKSDQLCVDLKALPESTLLRAECNQNLAELRPLLEEWSQDYVLRYPRPAQASLQNALNQVLAEASLPAANGEMISLMRNDPFQAWKELKTLVENRIPLDFKNLKDYIVITIQFNFPPTLTLKTAEFKSKIAPDWYFVGPHSSTLQNESQIMKDVSIVSRVGFFILFLLALFFLFPFSLSLCLYFSFCLPLSFCLSFDVYLILYRFFFQCFP